MSDEPPSCDVTVTPAWAGVAFDLEASARRCTAAVIAQLRVETPAAGAEVGFRFTDDHEIAELNARWRGRDGATDVLSFPATDPDAPAPAPGLPLMLGDVVLAYGTCAGDAARLERPLERHVCHLLVHGLLHLFHYDHATPEEARVMEPLEVAVLARLGVPDPYAGQPFIEETS